MKIKFISRHINRGHLKDEDITRIYVGEYKFDFNVSKDYNYSNYYPDEFLYPQKNKFNAALVVVRINSNICEFREIIETRDCDYCFTKTPQFIKFQLKINNDGMLDKIILNHMDPSMVNNVIVYK